MRLPLNIVMYYMVLNKVIVFLLLFLIYIINNLASHINELHCGIKIDIKQVGILLYAYDIYFCYRILKMVCKV